MDDLLPCQRVMLASVEHSPTGWRIYRCKVADGLCAVSGHGPDLDMLRMVCNECTVKLEHRLDRT